MSSCNGDGRDGSISTPPAENQKHQSVGTRSGVTRATILCPLPPKPGFGVWVWEGLSGGCRAGLTLERCSQLAAFPIQPVGWDAAVVWLAEDGVPGCAPLPSSNLVPFGVGGCGGTREAGSTVVAESLVALYRVCTHQIRRRRRAARSSTSHGSAEPLCARIKGADREASYWGKSWCLTTIFFSSYEDQQGTANGQGSWGFFRNAQCFEWLDAGSRAGFTRSRLPPPWISVFQFSLFLYDVWPWENNTDWSVICPLCCWECWPWVGDNNPSRSRLLSIWSKEVWCDCL